MIRGAGMRGHLGRLGLGVAILAAPFPAFAACTSTYPATNETVVCTGSSTSQVYVYVPGVTVDVQGSISTDGATAIWGSYATDTTLYVREGAVVTTYNGNGTIYYWGSSGGSVIIDGTVANTGYAEALRLESTGPWSVFIGETGVLSTTLSSSWPTLATWDSTDSVTIAGTIDHTSPYVAAINLHGGDDRLELWSTYAITGYVTGGWGTDTLALGGPTDGTFDVSAIGSFAQFRDFEKYEKAGTGTWMLTGTSTALGTWDVNAGALMIANGADVSTMDFVVNSGGKLGGAGRMGGVVVNDGGVFAPYRNDHLNTHVSGDMTFEPGSVFEARAENDAIAGSRVTIGGTLTINGGEVAYLGNYALPGSFYIISAASIVGQFDGVRNDFAFLDAALSYETYWGTELVVVNLTRNANWFGRDASTPNQRAAAIALGQQHNGDTAYDATVGLPDDPAAVNAALDSFTGEIAASTTSAMIASAQYTDAIVAGRLRGVFGGAASPGMATASYGAPSYLGHAPASSKDRSVAAPSGATQSWAQGIGSWSRSDGDGNAASITQRTGGLLLGGDAQFDIWRLGVYGGYSRSAFNVSGRSSSGDSDSYHAGAYAGTVWSNIAVRTGFGYTWHDIEAERRVVVGGLTETLSADYDAGMAQAFAEFGYGFTGARIAFEPFVNLAHVRYRANDYTETGGGSALSVAASTVATSFTTLGLRASRAVSEATTLRGSVGWRHAYGDITPSVSQSFASGGPSFVISGTPVARDVAVIDAGFDTMVSDSAQLGFNYNGQYGDSAAAHTVNGTLLWRF